MAVVDKFAMKNLFSPIHNGFLNAKLAQYLNPDCNTKLEKENLYLRQFSSDGDINNLSSMKHGMIMSCQTSR